MRQVSRDCGAPQPLISFFTVQRNLPSPSASGWLIDLRDAGGPTYVVLRVVEDDAADCLVEHLTDIGAVVDVTEAAALVSGVEPVSVAVVW